MATNLTNMLKEFDTEEKCRAFLVRQRWNGTPTCPYCGSKESYNIENGKRYKCVNNACYKKYSVTVGSIFHASNIPLTTWFAAIYILTAHKKGISSIQLAKDLGVTQKTAWFMNHRIRENLKDKNSSLLGNTVEVDEVYIGGKVGNMSKKKRQELKESNGQFHTKTMVMGMLERNGDLRLMPVAPIGALNINKAIRENVATSADIITDSHAAYHNLSKNYNTHNTVNHSTFEFVKEGNIHTNSIEGAFSQLKRAIYGIYHHVSPKHLHHYCNESAFKYNKRKMKDADRFAHALTMVGGHLFYKDLVGSPVPEKGQPEPPKPRTGQKTPVYQLFDGEIVAQYESVAEASRQTGILDISIYKVLRGKKATVKGYQFIYVI